MCSSRIMIDVAGSLSMSRLYLRYADFLDIGRFISLLLKIAISDALCVGVQYRAILFPVTVHRSMTRNPERVEPFATAVAIAGLAGHWLVVVDFVSVSVKCFHRSPLASFRIHIAVVQPFDVLRFLIVVHQMDNDT